MNGTKFLLDTNFVIGLVKGNQQVTQLLEKRSVTVDCCAYSFMSRIELLGYPDITQPEIKAIQTVLASMRYLSLSQEIEDVTIHIRRQYSLKIPDAIIAATAKVMDFELLTLDRQLANRVLEI